MLRGAPQMWFKNAMKQKLDITAFTLTWKKYLFFAFLEGACFILKVKGGDFASLCEVSAQTDKK